jgi:hypothetical protein
VTWYDLTGDGINFAYTTELTGDFTNEVVAGTQYKMRVRAHNVHGWSTWSLILIIRSTGLPLEPTPPSTLIENGIIKVSWVDPVANYEAIDSYQILFAQVDYFTLTEITLYCNGGADEDVISDLYCEMPLAILTSSPFNLVAGNEVKAMFASHNANGWGPFSELTETGALI